MKRFEIYNSTYEGKLPKITYIYNGYHGLKKGVGIHFNSRFMPLILPVNERGYKLTASVPYVNACVDLKFKLPFKQKLKILFCSKMSIHFIPEPPAHPMCRCSVQPIESEVLTNEKSR